MKCNALHCRDSTMILQCTSFSFVVGLVGVFRLDETVMQSLKCLNLN